MAGRERVRANTAETTTSVKTGLGVRLEECGQGSLATSLSFFQDSMWVPAISISATACVGSPFLRNRPMVL
jgi:hypothetical protein